MLNEYTFKWLPTSLQCFPALSMPICNSQYISRNSGFVNIGISDCLCLLTGFGWTVAVYRSYYLTHILVLAKYVRLPLRKMVLTLISLLFFQLFFPCKASGGGGVHGGHIQPVTIHPRVNIREFIISIKQYGGHL